MRSRTDDDSNIIRLGFAYFRSDVYPARVSVTLLESPYETKCVKQYTYSDMNRSDHKTLNSLPNKCKSEYLSLTLESVFFTWSTSSNHVYIKFPRELDKIMTVAPKFD